MIEKLIRTCIDPKWKYPGGGQVLITLQQDLETLKEIWPYEGIADERVVDYIVYQVYRVRDTIENHGYWAPHNMFTQYARGKYKAQFMSADGKSGMNYYINQWLYEYEISRGELTKMIEEPRQSPLKQYVFMEADEAVKRRFYNTETGYLLCQKQTTGWAPKSVLCQKCSYQQKCKDETKYRLPELVRIREEEQ